MIAKPLISAALLAAMSGAALAGPAIEVSKTKGRGCCRAWIDHLEANGLQAIIRLAKRLMIMLFLDLWLG